MNRTTVFLPATTKQRIQVESRRTGLPQSEIIRVALERYLDQQERVVLHSLGALTKKSLSSANQEEWLRQR